MAALEQELGLSSTWYFRWRTANPRVIATLRRNGHTIGFHYETLSRLALRSGVVDRDALRGEVSRARDRLRAEIAAFSAHFGLVRSIAAHGDSRVPAVRNQVLVQGQDLRAYGVDFDANQVMRGAGLAEWLTDRSRAEGGWANGKAPDAVLADDRSPILCLTHPNNWASGVSLWGDRVLRATVPAFMASPIRTQSDDPRVSRPAGVPKSPWARM